MACVRKRRGKYVVDWRDRDGVRHWKSFDKKVDADAHRDKVGPEARKRARSTVPAKSTLAEYAAHWLSLVKPTLKPRTHARYADILRLHILPNFEKVRVRDLEGDRDRIKLFLTTKLEEGLDKNTVRNIHGVLRALLYAAIESQLIDTNPAAKLGKSMKLVESPRDRQEDIKAMTKTQRQHFLATALRETPRYYPLFFVLAGCGMRLGECLGLQDQDLDENAQTIRIARAFSEDGTLGLPKTKRSSRTVDMSHTLTAVLTRHLMAQKQERLKYGWTDQTPWLFTTKAGTPLDPANIRKAMQSILKKAKLPLHFTPHCLRHTYASILLSEGVPAPYVQEQLGHATIELTVSTYGKWLKKRAPGALDQLDAGTEYKLNYVYAQASGSKVVASKAFAQNPQTGAILQLPEISMKGLELARGIEPPTCGLQMA